MSHRYPKRSELKYTKKPYKIRNWREYEAGLCTRGELALWFSEEAIEAWQCTGTAAPAYCVDGPGGDAGAVITRKA